MGAMLPLRLAPDADSSSHSPGECGEVGPRPEGDARPAPDRLNLLLSAGGAVAWRDESWADCLPRLLEPMGVKTWRVRSGREAAAVIRSTTVHIALVDLALPLDPSDPTDPARPVAPGAGGPATEGGARLLELLARLDCPPTTVVVKRGRTHREDARTLGAALHAGAFAVLERPVQLETALEVIRRILTRRHCGRWPGSDQ